jgi:hypothetical protein
LIYRGFASEEVSVRWNKRKDDVIVKSNDEGKKEEGNILDEAFLLERIPEFENSYLFPPLRFSWAPHSQVHTHAHWI